MMRPAQKAEGVWKSVGPTVDGLPTMQATFLHPAKGAYARVIWMDPKLLTFRLYAGTQDPAGHWKYRGIVKRSDRANLAATFNSGFMTADSHGGFYAYGKRHGRLVAGAASVVILANGTATVGAWKTKGLRMGPTIDAVRQTLTLMVQNGRILPSVHRPYKAWGSTFFPGAADWRTGLGVTETGALVFVGGANLTPVSLAKVLLRAGCVNAMTLDINPAWPSFNVYKPKLASRLRVRAHKMLSDPASPPSRYVGSPDARDFFAAFVRAPGG